MNKNDAAIHIFAQLITTHMPDGRIAHLSRHARAAAIAELAVYYASLLDVAFMARDEEDQAFRKEVRELWRLGEK